MLDQLYTSTRRMARRPLSRPVGSGASLDRLWEDAETVFMHAGTLFYGPGMKADYVYRLITGRVDVFHCPTIGKPVPLYHVGAGDYLIDGAFSWLHDTSARCTTAGKLQRLSVARFHALLWQDASLALTLCQKLAGDVSRLRHACQQRDGHAATTLKKRILAYLTEYADPVSGKLELPYTLTHWARELGVASETLSRALHRLQVEGALERPSPRTLVYLEPRNGS